MFIRFWRMDFALSTKAVFLKETKGFCDIPICHEEKMIPRKLDIPPFITNIHVRYTSESLARWDSRPLLSLFIFIPNQESWPEVQEKNKFGKSYQKNHFFQISSFPSQYSFKIGRYKKEIKILLWIILYYVNAPLNSPLKMRGDISQKCFFS